jgi:ribosomal-protein-alanine N-acetyltransferase
MCRPPLGGATSTEPVEVEEVPPWLAVVERACFGDTWGGRMPGERLFVIPEVAFARFAVVPAAGEAELLRIGVSPAARGFGHARQLLDGGVRVLAAAGIRRLFLEVRVGNAVARRLYARVGWTECGRRARYYADGEDAVVYAREIT